MTTLVRCEDRMVFEIDPVTTEAKSCSHYDAYCFLDPRKDVEYMSYSDWLKQQDKHIERYYK